MNEHLHGKIESYLLQEISLEDLSSWIIQDRQTILDSWEPEAIRLANALDEAIILCSKSLLDEMELKGVLDAAFALKNRVWHEWSVPP